MNPFKKLFRPSIHACARQFIGMLAHLSPFSKIEYKKEGAIVVHRVGDNMSEFDVNTLYQEWLESSKGRREQLVLKHAGDVISATSRQGG